MSSPLLQFANGLILWNAPGGRTGGRDGYKITPGQAYLIRAFLKRGDDTSPNRMNLPGIGGEERIFSGYCCSWAAITDEQAANYAELDLSTLTFDLTATLPPDLAQDERGKLTLQGYGEIDIRFAVITSRYGYEGIGSILRTELGDQLVLDGGQA